MRKDFRILLDMDDVITDFLPCIVEEYNDYFGENHSLDEITEWVIPSTFDKGLLQMADRTDFLTRVRPKGDSVEYINKWIDEGYEVYIVSNCIGYPKSYEEKMIWLEKHIPNFDVTHFIPCKDKHIIQGDILVDDNFDNLEKWSLSNPYGHDLLFTAQHNKDIKDERRVSSFAEVDDYIKVIEVLMSLGDKARELN